MGEPDVGSLPAGVFRQDRGRRRAHARPGHRAGARRGHRRSRRRQRAQRAGRRGGGRSPRAFCRRRKPRGTSRRLPAGQPSPGDRHAEPLLSRGGRARARRHAEGALQPSRLAIRRVGAGASRVRDAHRSRRGGHPGHAFRA
ncbi:MAG: hypothetical protein EB084_06795 [Proteobacteria bacterium]|nr:hypothetical protein [Pseudomonadota bacterium]